MIFGIVGLGRFGQLWAKSLLPYGTVRVYDKNPIVRNEDQQIIVSTLTEVSQADIIFLLTPISEFENSCRELATLVSPHSWVVDCCSVKTYPVAVMQRVFAKAQPLLATHPLFGPDSVGEHGELRGHKIVVCPLQNFENNPLRSIFKKMGLEILLTTPEEHDQQMARSQSLVHFIGRGLAALDLQQQQLATPGYQTLLNIRDKVAADTQQLFLDMHRYNPYAEEMRQQFIRQLVNLEKEINDEKISS